MSFVVQTCPFPGTSGFPKKSPGKNHGRDQGMLFCHRPITTQEYNGRAFEQNESQPPKQLVSLGNFGWDGREGGI